MLCGWHVAWWSIEEEEEFYIRWCRAARFCNGAAHGGQVVGPTSIIPGLLQAWGCEKLPDDSGPATFIQVQQLVVLSALSVTGFPYLAGILL